MFLNHLKKSDTNAKSTNSPNVTFDLNTENIQAALGVDLHCGLESIKPDDVDNIDNVT